MKKTKIFLLLAVVITAVFLTACQKETSESPDASGLYLKSAAMGDMASVSYLSQGQMQKLSYPNNLLFSVAGQEAEVLNNYWLKIDDFNVLSGKEVFFRISAVDSKTLVMGEVNGQNIYAPNSENVTAVKLPALEYGEQSNDGAGRFNGLLKAANYVLAINGNNIQVYDLNLGGEVMTAAASVSENTLSFVIQGTPWSLRFLKTSPIGNIFELSIGESKISTYSLRF